MTTRSRAPCLILLAALAAPPHGAVAGEPSVELDDAPYRAFVASGEAATLLALARRAYADAAGVPVGSPLDIPGTEDRRAGPRDEPPPPGWPAAPTGLVVCLRIDERVLACEGSRTPPDSDLAAGISILAGRLAASRSRGRAATIEPDDRPRLVLEAAFVAGATLLARSGRRVVVPEGTDLDRKGFVVEAAGSATVTLPGEAGSARAALRMARMAGVRPSGDVPPAVWLYTPVARASVPAVTP